MNLLALTIIQAADTHEHETGISIWNEFLSLATDPAHLLFELAFSLVFDILIVSVIYGVIIKKVIIPKLRRDIHREIDAEHGYEDHETGKKTKKGK